MLTGGEKDNKGGRKECSERNETEKYREKCKGKISVNM